jgi:hypothetical protein
MTSYAVLVNHFLPGFLYIDNLGFSPERENCCMSKTVLCLEKVFVENIIMGYMAFIAVCFFTVGAVIPGSILGSHDMTVYTGLRLVAKIGSGI